jgi:hypothetical protein
MLQKIEASLQQLIEQPSVSREHMTWATSQAKLFFGSFRKADADNPEAFSAGCLRLFTAYDSEVVRYVVDPVTGLPGRSVWLPSLSEVKSALDIRAFELSKRVERERNEARVIAERQQWQAARKEKPTLEELQKKYGPTWGLPERQTSKSAKADRLSRMADANRRTFEAECTAAGADLHSTISPSLAKLIEERKATHDGEDGDGSDCGR